MRTLPSVEIVLSVHNGMPFLEEQVASLQAQTHPHWRLWVRDDGSTDGSWEALRTLAAKDRRIHLLPRDGQRLGSGPAYGWLLSRLPEDFRYVFCCDADDVWLPEKIEISLETFQEEEGKGGEPDHPLLLHTDLRVVNERLETLHGSLWNWLGFDPEPAPLDRLLVQNVATGPTLLLNRPLVRQVIPIPPEAVFQDWWIALVASAVGRIVVLRTPTVLYRRHSRNATGGRRQRGRRLAPLGAWARRSEVRRWADATARQAAALLERHGPNLTPPQRAWLRSHASLAEQRGFARKLKVMKHLCLEEYSLWKKLGILARA